MQTTNPTTNFLKNAWEAVRVRKTFIVMLLGITLVLPILLLSLAKYQSLRTGAAPGNAVLAISPPNQTVQRGQSGTVSVFLDPNGESVNGIELYINYNPATTQITSIAPGTFFTAPAATIGQPVVIVNTFQNGTIHYAVGFPLGSNYSSTTANTAVTIAYNAVAAGTSNFTFTTTGTAKTLVSNINAQDVLKSATNGTVTVTAQASPTPTPTPSRSPSPTPTSSPSPTPTGSPSPTPTPSSNASPSPSPTPTTPTTGDKPGDLNSDQSVNIIDIGIIIDNYNKVPLLNVKADINGDNEVNIIDLGIVIDNYGS